MKQSTENKKYQAKDLKKTVYDKSRNEHAHLSITDKFRVNTLYL